MSDCNNNNIVSVERDICTGIGKNTIHQLNKLDEKLGKRKRVRIYPITYIQAVYDAKTGTRLDNFLNMVNSIYLPWRGTAKSTRLQVPYHLRRKGLMISYRNIDNEIITEKCILEDCIKDDLFKLDSSWVRITDALPVSGNVTIGSNGNWFVDGEDTGFKAQGPKGDNGMPLLPRLSEDGTKIEYSLDGEEWKELFPLSLITPNISFEEPVGLEPGATPTVENVGDGFNVNLQFGLPKAPEVNVGSTTTIGEGNQAKVTNSGTPYAPVLNFQIPKGDTGRGITIKGFYPDLSTLQEKVTSPAIGDVYCVGSAEPYTGYVWTNVYSVESQTATPAWQSIGSINKDTTILVNDLGDREDVGVTQKGVTKIDLKLIKLYAFGTDSSMLFDGQVYYNTDIKKLRKRINANQYEDIDYIDGAIYTWNGELYLYNGTELVLAKNTQYEEALNYKLIELTGMGSTSAGNTGVTKVGDIFYSTQTKQLWRCIEYISSTSFNSEVIPFLDGAIYTFNNELWIYNGKELIKSTESLESLVSTVDKKIVKLAGWGTMAWGNTGVVQVGDIFYSPVMKKLYKCISYTDSDTYQVEEYPFSENTIYQWEGKLYSYNGICLASVFFDVTQYTQAYIENRQMTCNIGETNPTASYNSIECLTDNIKSMLCKAIWNHAPASSYPAISIALISNPNGLYNQKGENTCISKKSVHIVFTGTKVDVGTMDEGELTVRHSVEYLSEIKRDGETEYSFGWEISDSGISVFTPDGQSQNFSNETDGVNYSDYCGKYCCFEFFSNSDTPTLASVSEIKIIDSNGFIIYDNFNRPDGVLGQTPAGFIWHQASSSEGYYSYEE